MLKRNLSKLVISLMLVTLFPNPTFAAQPTFVSAETVDTMTIAITFSEPINSLTPGEITSGDFVVASEQVNPSNNTQLLLTLTAAIDPDFTSVDLDIGADAVEDQATTTGNAEILNQAVSDGFAEPQDIFVDPAPPLTEDEAGSTFTVRASFQEVMDTVAEDPSFTFSPDIVGDGDVTFESATWINVSQYRATYTLNDTNKEIDDIAVTVTGGIDDAEGNQHVSTEFEDEIDIDTITQAPTLTTPADDDGFSGNVDVDLTLPEAPTAGTVTLEFDGDVTETLTLVNTLSQDFSFDPADPTASANVNAATDVIPEGIYDVTLSYQDAFGNSAGTAESTGVIIDSTDPVIAITAPTKTGRSVYTDTTIQVTDNVSILAADVSVDGSSTATTSNFDCTQTNTTTVDCTIRITGSGDLVITAVDGADNPDEVEEEGYITSSGSSTGSTSNASPNESPDDDDNEFPDVTPDHKYYEAIKYLYDNEIIDGYEDGEYKPENPINRAEFAKIVAEALEDEEFEFICQTGLFTDFLDAWYAKYACYLKLNEILQGYPDGSFRGANSVNLAEAAKIGVNTFIDAEVDEPTGENWFQPYIDILRELEAIPEELEAADLINRGQMAYIVWKLLTS